MTLAVPAAAALDTTGRLLAAFARAASTVPAYRQLIREYGVEPAAIIDLETFAAGCPVLSKANTFDRFPIDQLCAQGQWAISPVCSRARDTAAASPSG